MDINKKTSELQAKIAQFMEGDLELTLEELELYFYLTRARIKQIEDKLLTRKFPEYAEYNNESEKLTKEQGYEPSDEQVAQKLKWPLDRVVSLKKDIEDFRKSKPSTPMPADFESIISKMPPEMQGEMREFLKDSEK